MHERSIGIILLNIGVRNAIAISHRQEYLARVNAIFTIQIQFGDRDSPFARDIINCFGQVYHGCEGKASNNSHVRDK